MQKAYERVNWGNHSTPINEDNLNKMDDAIDKLDDRTVMLDSTKFNKTSANQLLSGMDIDDENSNIVLRYYGGGTQTIHTEIAGMAATAREAAEQAKEYAEQALSTTPGGYEQMVSDVDLLKNSIIRTTDRTLYGSKAGGIKLIGVKGASEQAVYSGAQLWDGTYVANSYVSNTTGNIMEGAYNRTNYIELPECESIYISSTQTNSRWGAFYDENKAFLLGFSGYNIAIDVPTNAKYLACTLGVTSAEIPTFQVEVGTEPTEIEPYTGNAPSPSPSYPQPIESVGDSGSLVIKQEGKNLADINAFGYITTNNRYGYEWTNMEGGTYTIMASSDSLTIYFGYVHNGVIVELGSTSGTATSRTYTFDIADGDSILCWHGSGITTSSFKQIQLEKGEPTPYEPYRSNTITIPLSEPLRGIGDIKDEIVCKDGVWGVNRKIRSRVFDGSENWQASSTNASGIHRRRYEGWTTSAPKGSTANTAIANVLCDSYIPNSANATYSRIQGVSIDTVGALDIYDETYNTSDISSWKAWLSENPITVEYELATPTFEPFTDQSLFYGMKSYDTVTYISTDSKVEPSIEVKFGRTEGDAITLSNYNRTMLNEIHISELMALQTELATALVAGSEV